MVPFSDLSLMSILHGPYKTRRSEMFSQFFQLGSHNDDDEELTSSMSRPTELELPGL